ncbi:uncharacterized protein BO95DRAFT_427059 [Aspergillus brunneoviolaceus CBS 621.78]|uniref:Uncharacterized protein n=1 Tax=Aspergillus brunneoviolaceus CBS 621.78 TaxID=1450534 RepID=A0ACD1GPS0_9EURO|nr:hypothetical protein BO95DRAFT_427059 [Aspergillus brunneoviolaceus CBS 621.78]RAH51245.1 hypothetical protein BO95DRAFT_427059 [Aspergillus brunneoviolaceus CBS 621.78]
MSKTPAGHRMPTELLLEVAKWMDDQTLSRLSRTCKGFRDEFRDQLRERAIAYAMPTLNPEYWQDVIVDAIRKLHNPGDNITAVARSALSGIISDQLSLDLEYELEAFVPRQPLYDAICHSQYDTVERLLRVGGVDVANGRSYHNEPMLHIAVEFGHVEAVRLLLEHGADPNVEDDEQVRALDKKPPRQPRAAIYRLLLDSGAIPSSLHLFGTDVLDLKGGACLLLDAFESAGGTGLDEPEWWGIFFSAITGEYRNFLEEIFDHRPDLVQLSREDPVEQKVTLFDTAVKLARFQIAALLVRKGAPLQDAPADYYFYNDKMRRIQVPYREVWKVLFTRAPQELLDALLERPELRDYEFKDAIRERASVMRKLLG